jgi:hypothetical protein
MLCAKGVLTVTLKTLARKVFLGRQELLPLLPLI